jgi:hypothetical protein
MLGGDIADAFGCAGGFRRLTQDVCRAGRQGWNQ